MNSFVFQLPPPALPFATPNSECKVHRSGDIEMKEMGGIEMIVTVMVGILHFLNGAFQRSHC